MPKESKYKINYKLMEEGHFINGLKVMAKNNNIKYTVINPSNKEELKTVPLEDLDNVDICIKNSKDSFTSWSQMAMHKRTQILIEWYNWINLNKERFINLITQENGKPYNDAKGEFERGIEVIQYSLTLQPLSSGKFNQVNNNLSIRSSKEPIGIVLAICPFNFPFMIPLWFIPISIILGNVIIIKPSEKVPGCVSLLAEGAIKSGIPNGVINILQGGQKVVENLIKHKEINAVSFVGSTFIGKIIYDLTVKYRKRIQCNMGAKNHVVVTKSADVESSTNGIISAAFGGCGQRCMALSVCIIIGENNEFIEKLINKTKSINIKEEMGPLITQKSKDFIKSTINNSILEGSEIILDRRKDEPKEGFYMGPVIIKTNNKSEIYQKELFGPVLCILQVNSLQEAINIINKNEYGNGTCIYTNSLEESVYFEKNVEVGQIGINVPIPVPPPYFSWSSSKESFIGNNYIYGPQSIDFYTKTKTVMTRSVQSTNLVLQMPTN